MDLKAFGTVNGLRGSAGSLNQIRNLVKIGVYEAFALQPNIDPETIIAAVLKQIETPIAVTRLHLLGGSDHMEKRLLSHERAMDKADKRIAAWLSQTHAEIINTDTAFDPHGFFVYVLWDVNGAPLYVGQSTNILSRLGTHLGTASKRRHVYRVTLTRHKTERQMTTAECRLIARYQPPWNTRGITQ